MKKWIIVILAIVLSVLMLSTFGKKSEAPVSDTGQAKDSASEVPLSEAQDQADGEQNDALPSGTDQISAPVQETPNMQELPPVELETEDEVIIYLEETQDVGGM